MKRIAAPMIGGVITSGILELLLYPVDYSSGASGIWEHRLPLRVLRRCPPKTTASVAPSTQATPEASPTARPRRSRLILLLALAVAFGVGGFFAWQKFSQSSSGGAVSGTPFAMQKVKDLTSRSFTRKASCKTR